MTKNDKNTQGFEESISDGFDRKLKIISLRFTAQEYLSLATMMKKDEWENISGFIKYKVFGTYRNGMDKSFNKLMDDLKSKDELLWLVAMIYPFIKQELDYVNLQYSKRLMEFDKLMAKPETEQKKSINKSVRMYEILTNWGKEIKGVMTEFMSLLEYINNKLDIEVKAEDYNEVTSIPLSVLFEYRRTHFDDTQSEIAIEASRRSDLLDKQNKEERERDVFGFLLKKKLDEIMEKLETISGAFDKSNKEKSEEMI